MNCAGRTRAVPDGTVGRGRGRLTITGPTPRAPTASFRPAPSVGDPVDNSSTPWIRCGPSSSGPGPIHRPRPGVHLLSTARPQPVDALVRENERCPQFPQSLRGLQFLTV
ncbi:hypothetical protein HMPREF0682_1421 [Propionibacterium acidifaciens F0233]|uniref:Uncharacterized protein n=1 Tax=Propionibacterium acidifaciens F0233 TaxID=553198 RepID=U2PIJ8_9ACTN|nr:hypothetical protein HMPREF0682_1421 [Propionibacterium acidifaciens F0233]